MAYKEPGTRNTTQHIPGTSGKPKKKPLIDGTTQLAYHIFIGSQDTISLQSANDKGSSYAYSWEMDSV